MSFNASFALVYMQLYIAADIVVRKQKLVGDLLNLHADLYLSGLYAQIFLMNYMESSFCRKKLKVFFCSVDAKNCTVFRYESL